MSLILSGTDGLSNIDGSAATPAMGTVIGKALQLHPDGQGIIEVVIGRI